jgi:protein O-GlcNAc transferase
MPRAGGPPTPDSNVAALQAAFANAFALHRQGRLAEAERLYEDILRREPNHFDALHLLGVLSGQTRRTERSAELIAKAIALNAGVADAHNNLGNALLDLRRFEEALLSFDKATALKPQLAEPTYNRGVALSNLGRHEDALDSFDRLLALAPGHVDGYAKKSAALRNLKRLDEALTSVDRAIALRPNHMEAHFERGNILSELKRHDEALASYDKVSGSAAAFYNRGNVLFNLHRYAEAVTSFDRAIALKPDYADAHEKRGRALYELWRYEEALVSFDMAIAHGNNDAMTHGNRGRVLALHLRYDEASVAYEKAFALDPELIDRGSRLEVRSHICDWTNFESESTQLIEAIRDRKAVVSPFLMFGIPSSAADQLLCARQWIAKKHPPSDNPVWRGAIYDHDRIRLAYLSADLRVHATTDLMAGLFEHHDRTRFETVAISWVPHDSSDMRTRLETSFERFVDVQSATDEQVVELIRTMEIDILVDLKGFTRDARTGVFARRPAPIQVNYLGYPGTLGASFIDYIIADRIVIPDHHHAFYDEKVVTLPDSYQVNDDKRIIADRTFTREELGLPRTGFVFCCFNNSYKINPRLFDCWMRILNRVEGSVLWLFESNSSVVANLRQEAAARGVAPDRLVFAPRMPRPEHLARHRLADLFLDTTPCNAHTTASDALWAGLPVLSILGETFAGRVAASLLNAVGLPELVADTLETYQAMAVDLATHPDKLAAIKARLADNRLTTPLFDTKRFTRRIEAAYADMYGRYRAGLGPEDIAIPT